MELSKIIETLRKMEKYAYDCSESMKKDREYALARQFSGEALALSNVIYMLTDDEYAANMAEIYSEEV